jgi:hypothetical protein
MENKSKVHRLYWQTQSGRRVPAGVAFYNEEQGDYRLKVDTFCEERSVYVKPVAVSDGVVQFRVEALLKKTQGIKRSEIGSGQASVEKGFPIYLDIGPYDRTLVIEAAA